MFPGKHILKHLFPACHVKVSKLYQSCMPPIASSSSSSSFTSSSSAPPSTTSSRSQWALPGLNRERQISVGTAGPQAIARSQRVQPDTASARSQWALPLSIEWGGATLKIFEKIHASLIANTTWKCVQHDCQAPCGNAEKSVS